MVRGGDAPHVQHQAVLVALNLSARHGSALLSTSILEALVGVLESHGFPLVQEHAARVLCNLSRASAQSRMSIVSSSNVLRRLSRLDLSKSPENLRGACKELMAALGSVLTPGSRRALLQCSLMPQDVHPSIRAASRAKAAQHRRPSPLANIMSTVQVPQVSVLQRI